MKGQIDSQEENDHEKEPLKIRLCSSCGKPLAEANPGPECFSCQVPRVVDIDGRGKIFRRPTTFKVISPVTVCTSRETHGFNRAYIDYHGSGEGL
jgi:hypothetical protein